MHFMTYALSALYEYYIFRRRKTSFLKAIVKNLMKTVKSGFIWKNVTAHPFSCLPEVKLGAEEDLVQMVWAIRAQLVCR